MVSTHTIKENGLAFAHRRYVGRNTADAAYRGTSASIIWIDPHTPICSQADVTRWIERHIGSGRDREERTNREKRL